MKAAQGPEIRVAAYVIAGLALVKEETDRPVQRSRL